MFVIVLFCYFFTVVLDIRYFIVVLFVIMYDYCSFGLFVVV